MLVGAGATGIIQQPGSGDQSGDRPLACTAEPLRHIRHRVLAAVSAPGDLPVGYTLFPDVECPFRAFSDLLIVHPQLGQNGAYN